MMNWRRCLPALKRWMQHLDPLNCKQISKFFSPYLTAADEEKSGTLKTGSVSKWLEEQGVLENTELPSGRKTRLPTEQGVKLGIETRQRTSQRGEEYTAVVYSKQAQDYIYSHIDEIAVFNNK